MIFHANAKINIGLRILDRLPNGYHTIETVMYPVRGLYDTLHVERAERFLFKTDSAQCGDDAQNLVVKCYNFFREKYNVPAVDVFLEKRIPVGAGLAGGSSDAATMAKALNEMFQLNLCDSVLQEIVANFGADCAFFIQNRTALCTGFGEKISPLDFEWQRGAHLVIACPPVFVSTKEAYESVVCSKKHLPPLAIEHLTAFTNDFEPSIFQKYPLLGQLKNEMLRAGAFYASMSGSGAGIYALFENEPLLKENVKKYIIYQTKI